MARKCFCRAEAPPGAKAGRAHHLPTQQPPRTTFFESRIALYATTATALVTSRCMADRRRRPRSRGAAGVAIYLTSMHLEDTVTVAGEAPKFLVYSLQLVPETEWSLAMTQAPVTLLVCVPPTSTVPLGQAAPDTQA